MFARDYPGTSIHSDAPDRASKRLCFTEFFPSNTVFRDLLESPAHRAALRGGRGNALVI